MAKTLDDATQTMIANLKEKTGRSLEDWVTTVRGWGALKHGEIIKRLKADHALGHGYANLVAHTAAQPESGPVAGDDLVETMFAGPKAALRPAYDALIARVQGFGGDVEIAPKKANVSLRRSKQFALVQPSTATRLDVGIQLKGIEPAGRLEAAGSFSTMVSHRVKVANAAEVDDELVGWLRSAYEKA